MANGIKQDEETEAQQHGPRIIAARMWTKGEVSESVMRGARKIRLVRGAVRLAMGEGATRYRVL